MRSDIRESSLLRSISKMAASILVVDQAVERDLSSEEVWWKRT